MHRVGAEIALSLGVVALGIGVAAVTAMAPAVAPTARPRRMRVAEE